MDKALLPSAEIVEAVLDRPQFRHLRERDDRAIIGAFAIAVAEAAMRVSKLQDRQNR